MKSQPDLSAAGFFAALVFAPMRFVRRFVFLLAAVMCGGSVFADAQGSGSISGGGGTASSTNYSVITSFGDVAIGKSSGGTVTNTASGSSVQLAAKSLTLSATPASVNEGGAIQIAATAVMDDDSITHLTGSDMALSLVSGPVAAIGGSGNVTTAAVYANSIAVVRGSWLGINNTANLSVLNNNPDNFGSYASDTIDDAWQVQYFGLNNPKAASNVVTDGTGLTNLFKYTAGLVPANTASNFTFNVNVVDAQPGQRSIVFSPSLADRNYTVQYSTDLASWSTLSGPFAGNGSTQTVTDTNAGGAKKFYRVLVSKP